MMNQSLLLLVDVQEKLFPKIGRHPKLLEKLKFLVHGALALKLPMIVTEQYPEGMGHTIQELASLFPEKIPTFSKTSFSAYANPDIQKDIQTSGKKVILLAGIEAHICILQTVQDLAEKGFEVIVLRDCIGSRHVDDYSAALFELSRSQARITSAETFFFECVKDKNSPLFAPLLDTVKRFSN